MQIKQNVRAFVTFLIVVAFYPDARQMMVLTNRDIVQ